MQRMLAVATLQVALVHRAIGHSRPVLIHQTRSTAPIARPTTSSAPACRTCTHASAAYHSGHTGNFGGGSSGLGRRKYGQTLASRGSAKATTIAGQGIAPAATATPTST